MGRRQGEERQALGRGGEQRPGTEVLVKEDPAPPPPASLPLLPRLRPALAAQPTPGCAGSGGRGTAVRARLPPHARPRCPPCIPSSYACQRRPPARSDRRPR